MRTRRVRGATALVLLLAVVAGLPWALAITVGNPMHAWPDLRAGDMSDRAVLAVFAAVAWIAWASFMVAFAVELAESIAAALTHRPHRVRRLPLLGVQQGLARGLIAAVFLLAPAVASAAGPLISAPAAPVAPLPIVSGPASSPSYEAAGTHDGNAGIPAQSPSERSQPRHTTYVVPERGGFSTYWDLASHFLGDPHRWQEIWRLNEGRTQADGGVMDSPRLLRAGWTVLIPEIHSEGVGTHAVTVQPGDTLSGLAEADGVPNWTTVWPANAGRAEPGGERLTDPNLIKPGWTVVLPGSTRSEPHVDGRHARQTARPSERSSPSREPAPPPQRTMPATALPPAAAPTHASAHGGISSAAQMVVFAAGGGVLLAGATLAALTRHRRRQSRERTPGRSLTRTPTELVPVEKALTTAGASALADVTWLDHALRGLAHLTAAREGGRLPDVVAVRLAQDLIELVLTTPHPNPPSPWESSDAADRWRLPRGVEFGYDETRRAYHSAPYPTLVSVGYTSDVDSWLIDLERVAAMSLVGTEDRCRDLARFLAAELAHNAWSEEVQINVIGFGNEMAALNPGRLSAADDLDEGLASLRRHFDAVGEVSDRSSVDVLAGRLHNIDGDVWAPHVALVVPGAGQDRATLDQLVEQMRRRPARAAISVVVIEAPGMASKTRWQLEVTADGRVRIPALDLDLHAQQLPAEEAADLSALLALAAEGRDEPMPAAHGEQPWDEISDVAGAPRSECVTQTDSPGDADDHGRRPYAGRSLLPPPASRYVEQTATTPEDVEQLAPAVTDRARRQIEDADPTLDEDLDAWRDEQSGIPKLALLRRPMLAGARGSLPEGRPRTDFYTEVVAFLATRPHCSVAELGTALWPNDPDIATKTTPRQAVVNARRWLGANARTGHEHIPYGGDGSQAGSYRVEGILVDADLFRRLRLRGVARGAPGDGIADLVAALELVGGVPFDRREMRSRRGAGGRIVEPYSWLIDYPLDREYTAMIVDTAHVVATHFLATGQPGAAASAAHAALRAGDTSDVPLLDLVAACDAQGNRAEAEEWIRKIMNNHDAEIEEDLPPRTYEVLRRHHWAQAS